jgi:RNA polymerase sigma-70 factor (ECF subfamily)
MRVLRNTFLNSRRTASRRPQVSATLEEVEAVDPRSADRPEHAIEATEVYAAIAALPDDFRLALVAVDIVGLSYAEAGRVLGAPEATITSRLHRARGRVVASVDGEGPPSRGAGGQESGREGSAPPRGLD